MSDKMNIDAISQALDTGLSTSVYEIFVPSMKRKVPFKPLLTGQCKTMAKIMIEANEKPLDTFKAVLGMIQSTCMEEDIDMNSMNELDRVKIMLEFYMNNNILKDFDLDCPKCGFKNKIDINLAGIVSKMEDMDIDPVTFNNGQVNELNAVVEIPKLPIMYRFYELVQEGKVEADEIVGCFISSLNLTFENKEVEPIDISLTDYDNIGEYLEAIRIIPFVIMQNEELGQSVFELITDKLDNVMSGDDIEHNCSQCGTSFGEVASAQNFI
jgi:hypothetical protein